MFPIIHAYILISFFSMELYMKWISIKRQSESGENGKSKSKLVSMSVIFGFVSQFLMDKVIPESCKGEEFFVFKVFFNNLIFFIVIPFVMIWNLGSLYDHSHQYLSSVFYSVESWKMSKRFQCVFYAVFKRGKNKIYLEISQSQI